MTESSRVILNVSHKRKHSNIEFRGTLPILHDGEEPCEVTLSGPCGVVSEGSLLDLFAEGAFGTKIAEEILEKYLKIQEAVLSGEDVSDSDMFFLLDATRRRDRHENKEAATDVGLSEAVQAMPRSASDHDELMSTGLPDTPSADRLQGMAHLEEPAACADSGSDSNSIDSDDDGDDARPAAPLRRRLVLQPEEVLFLSHALGCVRVRTASGEVLASDALFGHLAAGDRHLAARYAAYLALRGRGWVVRDGLLSGADFVVYKRGPAFYHASVVASVQVLSLETRRPVAERNWRSCSWLYVAGLCRTAEQAAKDVLLVRLLWPDGLEPAGSLAYLRLVSVEEVLVQRRTPRREPERGPGGQT
ncbi:tRNA-splicing endonuclease subunit Sen2-like isoform X2 [Pollicipes pollicipes]|nr:tRNA-splicing endonuclease subunit Sen2-like isoform X2 [Pollicipes pollicipes]XP_037070407.1 tRNA-splicing endonuclease subunit Sen2-like isoform X2 [Pollicipes pollicipes]XP_037070408.1 tRNA-splicing endonuclease subunit Sen2-like isoform X2 [Pollicipes pollicipes]XP_037070409.1 tRNA-splicing endonuclease subunit Sen2-like isoform X2 [Pollicipes pollicipes]